MIEFTSGNLFEANVEALVNTVNTVGVMGKGIALQFSRQYPEIMPIYESACKDGTLVVGQVQTIRLSLLPGMTGPAYVLNFPTKRHWKGDSKIEYIEGGLQSLRSEIIRHDIKSVAMPPLGCGLGGLSWGAVRGRIVESLGDLTNVRVVVFEPAGTPAAKAMKSAAAKPKMTPGRAALLGLMKRYMVPLMDDAVTLLELHKLMYFMQEAGEPLRLEFVKGKYGPYATNLRHVLNAIEGHFLIGFGDASEEPGKPLEPMPGAMDQAEKYLRDRSREATLARFNRVEELMEGFETAYGLELLGSVHWVARHEPSSAKNHTEATALVHSWNERKRGSFPRQHIEVAWKRLFDTGWLK
jgi:O-acetyl-ADP-ribose deacetylase (regulator of RNase III)